MQKYDENSLMSMSRLLKSKPYNESVYTFLYNLNDLTLKIFEALEKPSTRFTFKFFGSFDRGGVVSEQEYINIALIINDPEVSQKVIDIEKTAKTKKQRKKQGIIEQIKMLFILSLEQYFYHKATISMSNNCIVVNALGVIGLNFNLYVFTHKLNSEITTNFASGLPRTFSLKNYALNYQKKNEETNGSFEKVCNILNFLATEYNVCYDTLLIETIMYNLPNELFSGFLNEQLFNVLNYYKINQPKDIKAMDTNSLINSSSIFYDYVYTHNKIFNQIFELFE